MRVEKSAKRRERFLSLLSRLLSRLDVAAAVGFLLSSSHFISLSSHQKVYLISTVISWMGTKRGES